MSFSMCSKVKQWLYTYKVEAPRVDSSTTGKYMVRNLDGAEKLTRRQAYSSHLATNSPDDILPYTTPLLPPASRYSRPGAMDPRVKYECRMDYSSSLSAVHAEILMNTGRARYFTDKDLETICEPRIDSKSTLGKRLAYVVKSLPRNGDKGKKHKEGKCKYCSVRILKGAPPLHYSAQGSVIGPAPLKASWSNGMAASLACPDVSVQGCSCSLTDRRSGMASSMCTTRSGQTSGSDYPPRGSTYMGHQFRSNVAEVLRHIKVSLRCEPHLAARPPVLRVTGLCRDKEPPTTPRCADTLYNSLMCSTTLGDRYGNRQAIPQCTVSMLNMKNGSRSAEVSEYSEVGLEDYMQHSPDIYNTITPYPLSYRPFF